MRRPAFSPKLASGASTVASSGTRVLALAVLAAVGVYMVPVGVVLAIACVVVVVLWVVLGLLRSPRSWRASSLVSAASFLRLAIERWRAPLSRPVPAREFPRLSRPEIGLSLPTVGSVAAWIEGARAGFRRADLIVLAIAVAGLAWRIHGAFVAGEVADVAAYADHVARVKLSLPIYRDAGSYPYLPGWLAVEITVGRLSELIHQPFWLVIRMLIVAADFALIFAIWWLATILGGRAKGRLAAIVYAASPIAILVSGYHGMFDSIPLLLTVIAAGLAIRGSRNVLIAGVLLGIAITLKPLAVLAVPIFLFATGWMLSQRLVLLVASGLVVLAVSAPILISDPPALFRNVMGYGGVNDQGISGFLRALWMVRTKSVYLPGEFGRTLSSDTRYLSVTLMIVTAVLAWRYGLMRMCGAVYLAFLLTFGAVSTQYLLWPVPFLLLSALPLAVPVAYCLAAAVGAIGFYLVFWQPIIFGPGAPAFQVAMAPQYLAGQTVVLLVIAIAYAVSVAPVFAHSGWRRPLTLAGVAVTLVAAFPSASQVLWLLQELAKIPQQ